MNYPYFVYPQQNRNYPSSLRLDSPRLEPEFDKREARRSVAKLFLATAFFILISTAVVFIVEFALALVFRADIASKLLGNPYVLFGIQVLSMYLIAFPIFLFMTRDLTRKSDFDYVGARSRDYYGRYSCLEEKSKKDGMSFREFIGLFFVCTTVMLVGSAISSFITSVISSLLGHTVVNATSDLILETPIGLVILVVVIIGPIVEEMIFRKVFIDVLGVYGNRFAIALSSFAFGFFHGNLSQLIYATLLGFILGYIYVKTHRIILPIIMHMLVNFFGTVPVLLVSESLNRLASIEEIAEEDVLSYIPDLLSAYGYIIIQYGFALIGLIVFIYSIAKRIYSVPNECELSIPAKNLPRIAFFNKGVLLFYLICVLEILLSLLQ